MNKRIVFVDDERPILRSIRRMLIDEPYDCHFFDNAQDALDFMKEEGPVELIVSDMRMPEMDGLALLKEVKFNYPSTLRVVLSGYSDRKIIMNVLEKNYGQFYLHKPYKNEELMSIIEGLFVLLEKMQSEKIQLKFDEIGSLPTLPSLHRKISNLMKEDAPVDGAVSQINQDFVLTGNIIHIANSAYYGAQTTTLKQAVMMLGMNTIQQIIVATGVFTENPEKIKALKIWEHALLVNELTTYIYEKRFGNKLPTNANLAGMMHSMGIVLMISKFNDQYAQVIKRKLENPDGDLLALEKEILGIDHMEMGGFLLNWWEMTLPSVEAALYYRQPGDPACLHKDIIYTVHLAVHIGWKILGSKLFDYPLDQKVCDYLRYDEKRIEETIDKFADQ